jgi:hypothetical protein
VLASVVYAALVLVHVAAIVFHSAMGTELGDARLPGWREAMRTVAAVVIGTVFCLLALNFCWEVFSWARYISEDIETDKLQYRFMKELQRVYDEQVHYSDRPRPVLSALPFTHAEPFAVPAQLAPPCAGPCGDQGQDGRAGHARR